MKISMLQRLRSDKVQNRHQQGPTLPPAPEDEGSMTWMRRRHASSMTR